MVKPSFQPFTSITRPRLFYIKNLNILSENLNLEIQFIIDSNTVRIQMTNIQLMELFSLSNFYLLIIQMVQDSDHHSNSKQLLARTNLYVIKECLLFILV